MTNLIISNLVAFLNIKLEHKARLAFVFYRKRKQTYRKINKEVSKHKRKKKRNTKITIMFRC